MKIDGSISFNINEDRTNIEIRDENANVLLVEVELTMVRVEGIRSDCKRSMVRTSHALGLRQSSGIPPFNHRLTRVLPFMSSDFGQS